MREKICCVLRKRRLKLQTDPFIQASASDVRLMKFSYHAYATGTLKKEDGKLLSRDQHDVLI